MHLEAKFPNRCVATNSAAATRRKQPVAYVEGWNPFARVLKVEYSISKKGEEWRTRNRTLGIMLVVLIAIVLVAVTLTMGGLGPQTDLLIWAYFLSGLIAVVALALIAHPGNQLKFARFQRQYLWLKGAGPEFLNSLPEWPGFSGKE